MGGWYGRSPLTPPSEAISPNTCRGDPQAAKKGYDASIWINRVKRVTATFRRGPRQSQYILFGIRSVAIWNSKQLDGMWKDLISNASDGPATLDSVEWLGRAALDVSVPISHVISVLDR